MKIDVTFSEYLTLKNELSGRAELLAPLIPDPEVDPRVRDMLAVLDKLEAARKKGLERDIER